MRRYTLDTIRTLAFAGGQYPVVDGHSFVNGKNGQIKCPNCAKHNKGKYHGEVSQTGMYRDTVIEVWRCSSCGHEYATRWIYDHKLEEAKGYNATTK